MGRDDHAENMSGDPPSRSDPLFDSFIPLGEKTRWRKGQKVLSRPGPVRSGRLLPESPATETGRRISPVSSMTGDNRR